MITAHLMGKTTMMPQRRRRATGMDRCTTNSSQSLYAKNNKKEATLADQTQVFKPDETYLKQRPGAKFALMTERQKQNSDALKNLQLPIS